MKRASHRQHPAGHRRSQGEHAANRIVETYHNVVHPFSRGRKAEAGKMKGRTKKVKQ